jgi:hypothetical protein
MYKPRHVYGSRARGVTCVVLDMKCDQAGDREKGSSANVFVSLTLQKIEEEAPMPYWLGLSSSCNYGSDCRRLRDR